MMYGFWDVTRAYACLGRCYVCPKYPSKPMQLTRFCLADISFIRNRIVAASVLFLFVHHLRVYMDLFWLGCPRYLDGSHRPSAGQGNLISNSGRSMRS